MTDALPAAISGRTRHGVRAPVVRSLAMTVGAVVSFACTAAAPSAAPTAPVVHWSYEGASGPDRWGELDEAFRACSEGDAQSPIDVVPAAEELRPEPAFTYSRVEADVDAGHTVQANVPAGSYVTFGDRRFDLLQFHFHTPSEHAFERERLAMEAHLVHRSPEGTLAVVGVAMREGRPSDVLDALLASMPSGEGDEEARATVDPTGLLPDDRSAYLYAGSLTTPPCSEGVEWVVMRESIEVSDAQVMRFADRFGENARPLQDRNDRDVILSPDDAP